MLIDNKRFSSSNGTVWDYLDKNCKNGQFKSVSGYYTIFALQKLLPKFRQMHKVNLILGNIVGGDKDQAMLGSKINSKDHEENNFNLNQSFEYLNELQPLLELLESDKVGIRTVDPNFCHSKLYLYRDQDPKLSFSISGSSNLTPNGLGIFDSSNVELNHVFESESNHDLIELDKWFQDLWQYAKDNKQEEIDKIKQFYKPNYTPEEIYKLTLWHLFQKDIEELEKVKQEIEKSKLATSQVFNTLYQWQQKGVISLIQKLEKYNTAILADGVGLGKTWQTLAVIKYFESIGNEVLVIAPKNLVDNWSKYSNNGARVKNRFQNDKLRFHTVASSKLDNSQEFSGYNLIVIDESHNLRNPKSKKYQFIKQQIIQKNLKTKVLMLSATPINNKIDDLQYQLELGICNYVDNFQTHFNDSLDGIFRKNKIKINKLLEQSTDPKQIVNNISSDLQNIFDQLTVCRTKSTIKKIYPSSITFPSVVSQSVFLEEFEEFVNLLFKSKKSKINFTVYKPSKYLSKEERQTLAALPATENQEQREMFLAKMMMVNLIKRLESSTVAFINTFERIISYHNLILALAEKLREAKEKADAIKTNQKSANQKSEKLEQTDSGIFGFFGNIFDTERPKHQKELSQIQNTIEQMELEMEEELELADEELSEYLQGFKKRMQTEFQKSPKELIEKGFSIGIKNPISSKDMGNFGGYVSNVKADLKKFQEIKEQIQAKLDGEDKKMSKLVEIISSELKSSPNQKILIFTTYKDTAVYINQNIKQKFNTLKTGLISGSTTAKEKEFLLRCFSPNSKIFNELPDDYFVDSNKTKSDFAEFWTNYEGKEKAEEIQVLIATDCISEGQNLQDCSLLINYDIHWNPVRLVQRNGRIDRIGSNHKQVKIINFWPGKSIDDVLNLKSKIDYKMALVAMAGGVDLDDSVDEKIQTIITNIEAKITGKYSIDSMNIDDLQKIIGFEPAQKADYQNALDVIQNSNNLTTKDIALLRQLDLQYEDIDKGSFGFDDISLEPFREDLIQFINDNNDLSYYPTPVYSGQSNDNKKGVILLLENKKLNQKFLSFIDWEGDIHYSHLAVSSTLEIMKQIQKEYPSTKFIPADKEITPATVKQYISLIHQAINEIDSKKKSEIVENNKTSNKLSFFTNSREDNYQAYTLLVMFIVT